MPSVPQLNWRKLPDKLAYFARPAEQYGAFQFEDRIYEFLRAVDQSNRADLVALSARMVADEAEINAWLDRFPMTHHVEARRVYFLGHLLALAHDAGFLSSS